MNIDLENHAMTRCAARSMLYMLACLACFAMALSPASATTFGYDASQPGFPNPDTAFGSVDVDLTLGELIALPDGAFMVPLAAAVTAEITTDAFGGIESNTYLLDPRYTTSTEQLSLHVELLGGNPAAFELIFFDSNGWRGCIADPASCEQRLLFISIPTGPGVATGTTFDSANPNSFVTVTVPEPSTGLLLSAGLAVVSLFRGRNMRRSPKTLPGF
jgi:hypothetical protein